jgi:hypothetical protein
MTLNIFGYIYLRSGAGGGGTFAGDRAGAVHIEELEGVRALMLVDPVQCGTVTTSHKPLPPSGPSSGVEGMFVSS